MSCISYQASGTTRHLHCVYLRWLSWISEKRYRSTLRDTVISPLNDNRSTTIINPVGLMWKVIWPHSFGMVTQILSSFPSTPVMYQSIPKPPIPPGQSPGIWLLLSSVQWGIWPKMRPARWGIWLSCQNVCQRSEAKGFRNSLIQHVSRVHGSLLLSIPRGFFCCCRFI